MSSENEDSLPTSANKKRARGPKILWDDSVAICKQEEIVRKGADNVRKHYQYLRDKKKIGETPFAPEKLPIPSSVSAQEYKRMEAIHTVNEEKRKEEYEFVQEVLNDIKQTENCLNSRERQTAKQLREMVRNGSSKRRKEKNDRLASIQRAAELKMTMLEHKVKAYEQIPQILHKLEARMDRQEQLYNKMMILLDMELKAKQQATL